MQLLGGQQREAFAKIKTHLIPEHGTGAGAGAIIFHHAVIADVAEQVEVLLHAVAPCWR